MNRLKTIDRLAQGKLTRREFTEAMAAFGVTAATKAEVEAAYGKTAEWDKLMDSSRWDKRDPADVDRKCGVCSKKGSAKCEDDPGAEGTIVNFLRDGVPLAIKKKPADAEKVVKAKEPVEKTEPAKKELTADERIAEPKAVGVPASGSHAADVAFAPGGLPSGPVLLGPDGNGEVISGPAGRGGAGRLDAALVAPLTPSHARNSER